MSETYLTVGALTDYLQYKFTADPYLQEVTVEGEVTNFKIGTKHKYFKLKDENEEKQIEIVRTKNIAVKPMDSEEAVLQMEMLGHNFFIYKDADTNDINIVYRRRDGKYGLIESGV